MRIVITLLLLIIASFTRAQVRQELAGIVQAERDFAQKSIDENIRAAFLANFDDETIAFRQGEPGPGRKGWLEGKANDAYLFWWPVWADIASSGDFGYTTGPAEWGGTQTEKKPTGGGYYASVWRKDKAGKWIVVADLGTGLYYPAEKKKDFSSPKYVLTGKGKPPKAQDLAKEKSALLDMDKKYVSELSEARISFQPKYLSEEARLHRPGRPPLTTPELIGSLEEKGKFTLEQVGGDMASSGDMGFTYGRVKATVIREEKETIVPLCYMRVWKKEGGVWKIVLDVIG